MFCPECGKPASRKFCAHCGAPLDPVTSEASAPDRVVLPMNWDDEIRYDVLVKIPEVRRIIADHADQARGNITAEQWFRIFDSVVSIGIPMEKFSGIAQTLWARVGVVTGKEREVVVPAPVGRVLVRALCFLARNGQEIRAIHQEDDACRIDARLPSNLFSLEGLFILTVSRHPSGSSVSVRTKIPGQAFDWGKSRRTLKAFLNELSQSAA
jgi:hypothetical protein